MQHFNIKTSKKFLHSPLPRLHRYWEGGTPSPDPTLLMPRLSRTVKFKFLGLSRTKLIFQDFPGPGNLRKKLQDFKHFAGCVITRPNLQTLPV